MSCQKLPECKHEIWCMDCDDWCCPCGEGRKCEGVTA